MKRKIYGLLALVLILPLKVYASSVTIELNCPTTAQPNEIVSCSIAVTPSGSDLIAIQSNFDISNATYNSFVLNSGWSEYTPTTSVGLALSHNSITTRTSVGDLKLEMPNSGVATVKLENVVGTDSYFDTLNGNNVTKTIIVSSKSSDANLKSLEIDGVVISPSFTANTTNYTATVPYSISSVTISAQANDSNAKVTGATTKSLSVGLNTFNIVVTAEDNTTKTYTIKITRSAPNTDTSLKSLKIDNTNINITNSLRYEYTTDKDTVSILPIANDTKATISNISGPNKLQYGANNFTFTITSESGKVVVYTIVVNRNDTRSSDNKLKTIALSKGTLNKPFDPDTTKYTISLPSNVNQLTITATKANSATYKNGYEPKTYTLNNGANEIKIIVVAENGDENEYSFTINKELNANTKLKSIAIDGNILDNFDQNLTIYELTTKKHEIEITAVPENSMSLVSISFNDEVVTGKTSIDYGVNTFTIKVTAENNDTATYIVRLNREDVRTLSQLKVNDQDIQLQDNKFEYNIEVDNNVTSVDVEAILQDSQYASFVANYGPRTIDDLLIGNNIVLLKIKDQNDIELQYKINVLRKDVETATDDQNKQEVDNPDTMDTMRYIIIGAVIIIGISFVAYKKQDIISKR